MVKALSWAEDDPDVDEGIDEEVVVGVNDKDEEVVTEVSDKDELVEVGLIEEIGVAVLEVKIEAELDKEVVSVVGVAVVVKEGIAVVVSGVVEATDDEAGDVEPPNVHSDPNGTYSKRLKQCKSNFRNFNTYTWTKVSQW